MVDIRGDIKEFNAYVKQTTSTLSATLLKAYTMVDNEKLKIYIRMRQLAYEDGAMLTTAEQMSGTETQYMEAAGHNGQEKLALYANIETFKTMLT
jgi:hypothetical protein